MCAITRLLSYSDPCMSLHLIFTCRSCVAFDSAGNTYYPGYGLGAVVRVSSTREYSFVSAAP